MLLNNSRTKCRKEEHTPKKVFYKYKREGKDLL